MVQKFTKIKEKYNNWDNKFSSNIKYGELKTTPRNTTSNI